jgi:hypothetical protein
MSLRSVIETRWFVAEHFILGIRLVHYIRLLQLQTETT